MREKILFLTSRFPYPLVGGDRITNYNILQILSRHYDVYFVSITHEPLPQAAIDSITPFCTFYKIFHKSKLQSYARTLRALVLGEPLQVGYYYFSDVLEYLRTLIHEHHIDTLLCALIRTAKYAQSLPVRTKLINMADSLAHHYQNAIRNSHSLLWKSIYTIEHSRLTDFESQCVREFDASLFFNHKEQQMYSHIGNALLAPHGINPMLFDMAYNDARYQHTICFFGKMDYRPNIEAVLWFANNVMPLLYNTTLEFVILGANPTYEIKKLQNDHIKISGYVENPYVILQSCLCVIAPMQSGAGIQNKILESMALGQIVLTNPLGANPIYQAQHGTHLLIAHTAQEFAHSIQDIASNPHAYQSIKANAKALIRECYTWTNYEKTLLGALHTAQSHKDS